MLARIKTRADFLRAQRGLRRSSPGLGLELCASPEKSAQPDTVRVGFTASRKVGGAVIRNRAKRRLRAAAASILPLSGRAGHDYVLIARSTTASRPFAELIADLTNALAGAHAALDRQRIATGTEATRPNDGTRDPQG